MKKGLVSVIVPNYNYAHFLGETIDSVIAQTYTNWELIVVDDNSTDHSREVVQGYIEKYPHLEIRLFHNEKGPSGTPAPINIGIRNMKGEYFAWLSSDDIFKPGKLEKQVQVMAEHPEVGMVYTRVSTIDDDGRVIVDNSLVKPETRLDFFLALIKNNFINGNTVLIRRNLFDQVGLFSENHPQYPDMWYASEYYTWLKLALCTHILGMNEPLHLSRKHEGNHPFSTSGFGERLRGLLFSMVIGEIEIHRLAAIFSIDVENMVAVEAEIRRELELCGHSDVALERHDALKTSNPNLEEKILREMTDFTRADYLVRNAELYLKRNPEKSIQLLRQGLELNHYSHTRSLYTLASLEKKKGNISTAAELFRDLLKKDHCVDSPYVTGAHFHLGEIEFLQQRLENAILHFKACLQENPGHRKAAEYLKELGLEPGVKDYWDEGVEQKPFKIIADVENLREFELSGAVDANMMVRHLRKEKLGRVLEIGCGIGRLIKPLAALCDTIAGVDASKSMIEKARDYLQEVPNKELYHTPDSATGLSSHSFDLIYSIIVFMHLPRVKFEAWVKEAGRLLKKDGVFWFQVFGDFSRHSTLPQECETIDGKVRGYSEKDIREITGAYFQKIDVFTDPLDREGGKYWYFCTCRTPKG